MSHYISTEIEEQEIILTGGSNHRTISAVGYSGFNIYRIFEAYSMHGGSSGSGEAKKIDFKMAKNAYKHAIAWAKAMEESFPEKYNLELNNIKHYESDFNKYLVNHDFRDEEIDNLVEEKRQFHHQLSEEQIKRSFYLFYGILHFTYHVYEYTKKGNEVEIGFV
jgi:hypothetical protein